MPSQSGEKYFDVYLNCEPPQSYLEQWRGATLPGGNIIRFPYEDAKGISTVQGFCRLRGGSERDVTVARAKIVKILDETDREIIL